MRRAVYDSVSVSVTVSEEMIEEEEGKLLEWEERHREELEMMGECRRRGQCLTLDGEITSSKEHTLHRLRIRHCDLCQHRNKYKFILNSTTTPKGNIYANTSSDKLIICSKCYFHHDNSFPSPLNISIKQYYSPMSSIITDIYSSLA